MFSWKVIIKYLLMAFIIKRPVKTIKTACEELGAEEENIWFVEDDLEENEELNLKKV